MGLLDARQLFTYELAGLLMFGRSLCAQLSVELRCNYSLILDETKRSRDAARWNAEHCRVVENGERCERPQFRHENGNVNHDFKPIGILESVHIIGLAADLLVMKDGQIDNDEMIYRRLGQWWKSRNEALCWGGDFSGFRDLGHFSHEYRGRK